MTLVRDVLYRDPTTWSIPNLGVTKVGPPQTPEEWNVLRYELQSFVAEGEYEAGLERVLRSFLTNLERDSQPAAWVSGFFGSGKSHLVRVLDALWSDIEFPDGARASGLVSLPTDVDANVRELRTRARQSGGAFSAAGTLSAGGTSAALSLLAIVFAAAGLPEDYPGARLVLWLKDARLYDGVLRRLEAGGKRLDSVLQNMYVSTDLAEAVLAEQPSFANSPADVRAGLRANFPPVDSLTDEQTIDVLDQVLRLQGADGQIPLTLIVLDELQQFLADDPVRTLEVQQLVEVCCSKFGSKLLFVATGQMALSATQALQKLQDRYTLNVTLRDTDVDRVVRSVVLRKKPEKEAEVRTVLDRVNGEISRHLQGSAIAATAADAADLVSDYPLLPSRRRFWDRVLRAMDTAGRSAKLRTQLRIVLDAARGVADRELGVVVGGDAVYDQLQDEFLSSGVLPRDVASQIAELDDGSPAGRLQARIAKVAFLIGRLPKEGARPSGVKATPDMISDLLVEDLRSEGPPLRGAVAVAVQNLADREVLIHINGEYQLQTKVSAEWAADLRLHRQELDADEAWIAHERSNLLKEAVEVALKGVRPTQGESKEARRYHLFFGDEDPRPAEDEIPVWVRDGWGTSERPVVERARQAGPSSPWVFVYLPRVHHDDLRAGLIEAKAADRTIERRPSPMTPEGIEARSAMASRRDASKARVSQQVSEILRQSKVFQAGGAEVLEPATSPTLVGSVAGAISRSVLRLYPEFGLADSRAWGRVVELARQGNPTPLSAVDHRGEPDTHPVAKAISARVPAAGRKGQELRREFGAPPYGWPQDAIDGTLLALVASGSVEARHNGSVVTPRQIPQNVLGSVEFRLQVVRPTMQHKLAVRSLAQDLDIPLQGRDEGELPKLIASRLHGAAAAAGGPAPLSAPPSVERIRDLEADAGPTQFIAFAEAADELKGLYREWRRLAAEIPSRLSAWQRAQRLVEHAEGRAAATLAAPTIEAIEADRSLLADPDPLAPMIASLCDDLRAAVTEQVTAFRAARETAVAQLESTDDWRAIAQDDRDRILEEVRLADDFQAAVSSPDELIRTLDGLPLRDWHLRIQAISEQAGQALTKAARIGQPETFEVNRHRAVIHTMTELDDYLSRLRADAEPYLKAGKAVVL